MPFNVSTAKGKRAPETWTGVNVAANLDSILTGVPLVTTEIKLFLCSFLFLFFCASVIEDAVILPTWFRGVKKQRLDAQVFLGGDAIASAVDCVGIFSLGTKMAAEKETATRSDVVLSLCFGPSPFFPLGR